MMTCAAAARPFGITSPVYRHVSAYAPSVAFRQADAFAIADYVSQNVDALNSAFREAFDAHCDELGRIDDRVGNYVARRTSSRTEEVDFYEYSLVRGDARASLRPCFTFCGARLDDSMRLTIPGHHKFWIRISSAEPDRFLSLEETAGFYAWSDAIRTIAGNAIWTAAARLAESVIADRTGQALDYAPGPRLAIKFAGAELQSLDRLADEIAGLKSIRELADESPDYRLILSGLIAIHSGETQLSLLNMDRIVEALRSEQLEVFPYRSDRAGNSTVCLQSPADRTGSYSIIGLGGATRHQELDSPRSPPFLASQGLMFVEGLAI
jgi:hypothetical protein